MKKNLLSVMAFSLIATSASAQYCEDGGPSNTFDTNIDSVHFVGESGTVIDYDDACTVAASGLIDATAMGVIINAGSTYTVDVNWNRCGGTTYSSFGSVWIDFNGNEIFDASEMVGDFSIAFGETYLPQAYTFDVPVDALNGTHRMRVMQREGGSLPLDPCASFTYGSLHDFGVVIMGGVDCGGPGSLTPSAITATTATLSWVPGALESEWEVEYGPTPLDPGTGVVTIVTMGDTSLDISGLSDNVDYDFNIRAICAVGDTSGAAIGQFTTLCLAIDGTDFCETFDDSSSSLNCWTVLDANDDGDAWGLNEDLFGTPTGAGMINTDFNGGDNDDYLISPNLTIAANQALTFKHRGNSSFEANTFEVLVSTTTSDPAAFTDTIIASADYDNTDYVTTGADLAAYAGQDIYVAFHVPNGGLDGWRLFIDDVCITVCIPASGTEGTIDVCSLDSTVDASLAIIAGESFGVWEYPENNFLVEGSEFTYSGLAEGVGTYELNYIVTTGCTSDTTLAIINVLDTVRAGNDGTVEACLHQPFDLLAGLSGAVDLGGFWTNEAGIEIPSSAISLPTAGTVTYIYNATNGVCPDDQASVVVTIDGTCDFLSLDENELNALTVFPNPTNGLVSISLNGTDDVFNYQVTDVTGRVIMSETNAVNGNANTTLDLSNQENGIYMIRVFNENSEKIIRVVRN